MFQKALLRLQIARASAHAKVCEQESEMHRDMAAALAQQAIDLRREILAANNTLKLLENPS